MPHVPLIRGEHGPVATLLNVQESDEDAKASVKGLTSYDGDLVVPRLNIPPVGYPMSLNVDKDPEDIERGDGPLFTLFPKDSTHIHKNGDGRSIDILKLMNDKKEEEKMKEEEEKKKKEEVEKNEKEEAEKKKKKEEEEEEKKKKEEEEKKKKGEEEAKKKKKEEEAEKKKKEEEAEKKKKEEEKKKKEGEEAKKKKEEDAKKQADEKKKEEDRKKEFEERKKAEERKRREEERKNAELNKEKNKMEPEEKKIVENKNNKIVNPRDKSFVCYLPKIVVITRMIGTTVVNEVKVYGDSHNENSVHKFISTHDVSANASELVNEFTLPPQFILGVSPELERDNDISIAKTAAYTNTGQLYLPGVLLRPPPVRKPPPNYNYGPYFTTRQPTPRDPAGPTYNPFLPTKSSTTTPTTTPITTPASTTQTTTTRRKTTTIPLNGDIISDIITKKSKVKNSVPKGMLEWLNYAARHRNVMADIPGGDPNGKYLSKWYIKSVGKGSLFTFLRNHH